MKTQTQQVLEKAVGLPPIERAELVIFTSTPIPGSHASSPARRREGTLDTVQTLGPVEPAQGEAGIPACLDLSDRAVSLRRTRIDFEIRSFCCLSARIHPCHQGKRIIDLDAFALNPLHAPIALERIM